MREYVLLLPIIFIFHDMEEIIGFGWFFKNNPELFDRFPIITKAYKDFTTAGMALAVYEEFIPFFGVSILAYFFPGKILYSIWLGIFLSLAGHFIIHIIHVIILRKYIPSFITSLICLPLSIAIITKSIHYISFDLASVFSVIMGVLLMIINLGIAHKIMHLVNKSHPVL